MADSCFDGGCHCGAIGFRLYSRTEPSSWSVRACQCQFCRLHGALSTSDPQGKLEFTANQPKLLVRYRFALRTADFLLCQQCGVYIGAVIETDGRRFGIINTRALDTQPEDLADVQPISYAGEDTGNRIGRRAERWTPVTGVPW